MKPEFKIGDSVIIVDLVEGNRTSHPFSTNESMHRMSGVRTIITNVTPNYYTPHSLNKNTDGALYKIEADNGVWAWSNTMFHPCIGNLKVVEEEL